MEPQKRQLIMLVQNDFTHDSRVRKEASSLTRAGFAVTVVAMVGPGLPLEEMHPAGFRVLRVGWLRIRRLLHWLSKTFLRPRSAASSSESAKGVSNQFKKKLGLRSRVSGTIQPFNIVVNRFFYYLPAFFRVVRPSHRGAIVLSHDLDTLPLGYAVSRLLGGPLVYDSHELHSDTASMITLPQWWRRCELWGERILVKRTNLVMTVNDSIAAVLSETYGIRLPMVIRNVPDSRETGQSDPNSPLSVRVMAGLGPEARIIAYSGGVIMGRGVEIVIQSLPLLPDNVHFVLLGPVNPALAASLPRMAEELSVGSRVHLLGSVPGTHVASVLASADVAISLAQNTCRNHYLCSPNKLYEALHAGLPVIASDFPEIRRVIEEWDVGLVVDPASPEDFARAARTLLLEPERLRTLRANAQKCSKVLCWEAQEPGLIHAFKEIGHSRTP